MFKLNWELGADLIVYCILLVNICLVHHHF
jgi:hypothetical protein